ncbi:MAG: putative bifunctional diguanylate cyclase/phosphodiesterase [Acidimicrobiales bacterium]
MSKDASERAKPTGQNAQTSLGRAIVAAAVLVGLTVLVYWRYLSVIAPTELVVKHGGRYWWALWPLVGLGIWASFVRPVAVRTRKMNLFISLSELPVLGGIVFLRPGLTLVALCLGQLVPNLQARRKPAKILANCSVYLLCLSLGILIYHHLLGKVSPVGVQGWLVSMAVVAFIALSDLVLVVVIMGLLDKRWRKPPLVAMLVQAGAYIALCTAGGLVAVSLVWVNIWGIALIIGIFIGANRAYQATVSSGQRYANLEKLYDFTRHLSALSDGGDVMFTVLEEARSLLNASRAELVVPLDAPLDGLVLRCSLEGDGEPGFEKGVPLSSFDTLVGMRGPQLLDARSNDQVLSTSMKKRGLTEALVAPLQREEPKAGYLLVANRPFQHEGFSQADLRFFETLAANAGVALRSSQLLEQLRREVALRQHQAHHDTLTGLPNWLFFTERLDAALKSNAEDRVAVMFIDLDRFREVNDTLGHVTGDAILLEVASRLRPFAGEKSVVARLGGDEFSVLLCAPDGVSIEEASERLLGVIKQPFAVKGLLLDIGASMGVAVAAPHDRSRDAASLMRHADVAMYVAKEAGGGVRFYDPAEDRSGMRSLTLATDLRRAIEQETLEVWYQPVVQIATGEVLGCEALLRWTHDEHGPISPVEFIPVAETVGLIDPLTWWVLDRALAQLRSWREFIPALFVAVNLSARSLTSNHVADRVDAALRRANMQPSALTLELTESHMDVDQVTSQRTMFRLKEIGVSLSIDDYGTGFSSLTRLKDLPFKELKIDRSFVTGMMRDRGDEAIVRSTIELGRSLGRNVTAEGVEDEATLNLLHDLGCHAAQGYYLARPLPARDCEAWLLSPVRLPRSLAPANGRNGFSPITSEAV